MIIDYDELPAHMRQGTKNYIENGVLPGSFLQAVICNDLFGAIRKADDINIQRLEDWLLFFYSDAPDGCYGSKEKMIAWINIGGLNG